MLTIAFITSRKEPRFDWFLSSLRAQPNVGAPVQIVIIDFFAQACDGWTNDDVAKRKEDMRKLVKDLKIAIQVEWYPPMPSVWNGPGRLPKDNWWAMAAARNTALCYARCDWFLHFDDRCVLQPGFMAFVKEHMKSPKLVFGKYEKRIGMTVENGFIKNGGTVIGEDGRHKYVIAHLKNEAPTICNGEWYYGCVGLGPLEWYLNANGWDTTCDGLSFEDSTFGLILQNNMYPMFYDHRMMIVEDRTPEHSGPQFKRTDKGVSPHDKSHALLDMLKPLKRAKHDLDLREIRKNVLAGKPFPTANSPTHDWYDAQPVKDF